MKSLIGRHKEIYELDRCMQSDRSEFVIVYGRRRVGKTFLINEYFNNTFTFRFVGTRNADLETQLENFASTLKEYSNAPFVPKIKSWFDAFDALKKYIKSLKTKKKKVIFFDEMPWMDTHKSGFVSALEYFWNSWADQTGNIVFIACGSATSWIVDKIIKNRGGLYCRTTAHIYLRPFTLAETEQLCNATGFNWDRFQIAQAYMVLGGVPYYYTLLNNKLSLAQNIDALFFSSKNAPLRVEFSELFASLFSNYEKYLAVIDVLSERREGFTRTEISEKTSIVGTGLTTMLENLERCDFIVGYSGYKGGKNNIIYRLCDFYTLFYYHFIEKHRFKDTAFWEKSLDKPVVTSWQGFSFELVCLLHLDQIKNALGISGIATSSTTWRSKDRTSQVDLVIERADRIVNLVEIKFSKNQYVITSEYDLKLRDRMGMFKYETKTRYGVNYIFITTYGVKNANGYSIVGANITLDDLFANL